ncbi:MAG: hypothetical protein U0350_40085 [Caldilineaceae bacterium]
MQYTITINLAEQSATITRYRTDRLGPVRRSTHTLTRASCIRLNRLCRNLTPLKIHRMAGFYMFAKMETHK